MWAVKSVLIPWGALWPGSQIAWGTAAGPATGHRKKGASCTISLGVYQVWESISKKKNEILENPGKFTFKTSVTFVFFLAET